MNPKIQILHLNIKKKQFGLKIKMKKQLKQAGKKKKWSQEQSNYQHGETKILK